MEIKIKKFVENAVVPKYAKDGDAAVDLVATENVSILPKSTYMVDTGIGIELPKGYAAFVLPRSGISAKTPLRVSNSPGLIDSGYRGRIMVICDNLSSTHNIEINAGDKIAQLMIVKHETAEFSVVDELSDSERGTGGFGSTGVSYANKD